MIIQKLRFNVNSRVIAPRHTNFELPAAAENSCKLAVKVEIDCTSKL